MTVIWTDGAAEDLNQIVLYIRRGSEEAGRRVAKTIFDCAMGLGPFPHKGHRRKSDDAYEIVCYPWPYVIIYEVIDNTVFIEGILHTSRDREL